MNSNFLSLFNKIGTRFSEKVNLVFLVLIYLLGIGLTAVLGKLFHKSFLKLKSKKSVWQKHPADEKPELMY